MRNKRHIGPLVAFCWVGAAIAWSIQGVLRSLQLVRWRVMNSSAYSLSSFNLPATPPDPIRHDADANIEESTQLHFTDGYPWSDMDLSQNGTCGGRKCFFPSLSQPLGLGYLVADVTNLLRMQVSTDMALQLQQEFGARHVFLYGGPQVVDINATLAAQLAALVHRPMDDGAIQGFSAPPLFPSFEKKNRKRNLYTDNLPVVVQVVAVVPPPKLWIGLGEENFYLMMTTSARQFWHQIGQHRAAWGRQFAQENTQITRIWQRHTLLYFDFQGIVSGRTGHFYHADLDGHLGKENWRNATQIRQQIKLQTRRLWYLHCYLMLEELPLSFPPCRNGATNTTVKS